MSDKLDKDKLANQIEAAQKCAPEVIEALEQLYDITSKIAFYFVPQELMSELLDVSKAVETALKKAKAHNSAKD